MAKPLCLMKMHQMLYLTVYNWFLFMHQDSTLKFTKVNACSLDLAVGSTRAP